MPLVGYRCPNGHEFTTLEGGGICAQDDPAVCPECQATDGLERLIGAGVRTAGKKRYWNDLSAEDQARSGFSPEFAQEINAEYAEMGRDLLDGLHDMNESRCYEEFRPQVPDHLKKNYHFMGGA